MLWLPWFMCFIGVRDSSAWDRASGSSSVSVTSITPKMMKKGSYYTPNVHEHEAWIVASRGKLKEVPAFPHRGSRADEQPAVYRESPFRAVADLDGGGGATVNL